uniref:C2H2-type domain-containing protein n=1 Tax=Anopheles atroparvus TaxID=41427 RepID=A0A182J6S7_ANOAO
MALVPALPFFGGNLVNALTEATAGGAWGLLSSRTISSDETLSNRICGLCYTRLDDAYCFIRDLRSNNASMLSFFNSNGDDDEASCEISVSNDVIAGNKLDYSHQDSTVQVNAVDLVVNEIAPAKRKASVRRGTIVRSLHQCTTCEKTFNQKSNLIDHQRLHEQVKLFKCDYCSKSFVQIANLRMHLRTHTAERPYQCKICQKSFTQSGTLQMHLRAHAKIKPHSCDTCEKAFLTNSDLAKHKLSHSGIKGFHCVLCKNRSFTQKIHLRLHLQKFHKLDDIKPLLVQGTLNLKNEQQ